MSTHDLAMIIALSTTARESYLIAAPWDRFVPQPDARKRWATCGAPAASARASCSMS